MSIEPGEHCGHACCKYPNEPRHSHPLMPVDCPRCKAIADEVLASWKEAERLKVAIRAAENMRKLGIPQGSDNPTLIALGAPPLPSAPKPTPAPLNEFYCPSIDVCAICGDVYCDGISCIKDIEADSDNGADVERLEQLQAWVRLGRIQEQANAFLAHVENRT